MTVTLTPGAITAGNAVADWTCRGSVEKYVPGSCRA